MAKVGRMVKESTVKELAARLSEQPNLLVTTVNRLPAPEADRLRQQLHGFHARLLVVKRTLGRRAIEDLKLSGVTELLEGTVGLVLPGEDVLRAAKVIVDFIKTHEEQLAVRGALIDGELLDQQRVEQLASLPPRPVLLAQLVWTIESPISQLIFTVEQLIGDLIWAADQAATKKPLTAPKSEGQAGAEAATAPKSAEPAAADLGVTAQGGEAPAAAPPAAEEPRAPEGEQS